MRSELLSPSTKTTSGRARSFARHYLEMLVAMLLGMAVLGTVSGAALGAFGVTTSEFEQDVPALLLAMAINMTVPMVAWMRYRGHAPARSFEMAMSMVVPTLLAVALYWADLLASDAVLAVQHAVMLPAMFAVMLWRYDEYASPHRSH